MNKFLLKIFILNSYIFISFFIFADDIIYDIKKKSNLNFYYIKSAPEEGKYLSDDFDKSKFKKYNNTKILKDKKDYSLDMYTFVSNFYLDKKLINNDLAISIGPQDCPYNIYLNKVLIFKSGRYKHQHNYVTYNSHSIYLSKELLKYNPEEPNEIIIEMFTRYSRRMLGLISLSSTNQSELYVFWRNFFNVHFIKGSMMICFLIFLYFFILFFLSKTFKDKKYIYYCFACLFYILSYTHIFLNSNVMNEILIARIARTSMPIFVLFFNLFLYEFSNIFENKKILKRICIFIVITINLLSSLLLFLSPSYEAREELFSLVILYIFIPIIFSNFILLIISIFKSKIRYKKTSLIIIFAGYCFLVFSSTSDIYHITNMIVPYAWITSYGFFVFYIAVFCILVYEQSLLRKEKNKLEKLDSLKNDFIANITHDFRSPLTAILNITELCLKTDTEEKENFNIINTASIKLKHSIDKLLDLAKMDAHGIKIKIRNIDPEAFLNRISGFYKSLLSRTGIKIKTIFPEIKITDFYTDEKQLEDALNNIISNAIKFVSNENGEIIISLVSKKKKLLISIEDNGIGISKNMLKVIFKRFEQAEKGRNSVYRGTGIGLAYAKQIIEGLKGKIYAESEGPGKGAKFIIELNRGIHRYSKNSIIKDKNKKTDNMNMSYEKIIKSELKRKFEKNKIELIFNDLNEKNEFEYKKAKIIIIDDDKTIREIIKKYLITDGYKNFILTSDGETALEAVYKYKPDLIICDYNMPNLRGDEFHDEIINNPELINIPFIFLSAITDEKIIYERRKKGACAYLKKPIDADDLVLTIDYHLKKYFEFQKLLSSFNK